MTSALRGGRGLAKFCTKEGRLCGLGNKGEGGGKNPETLAYVIFALCKAEITKKTNFRLLCQ